jgi:integrase
VKEQHKERPIFEMRELAALFAEPWLDPRAYGACLLAFTTGARMGEVRGLLIKNVHLSESYTDIVTNYVAGDGMKPPKWGGQRLGVPLPDITIRAIQSVMDIHPWGAEPEQFLFFSTESRQRPCDTKLIDKGFFSKLGSLNIPRAGRSFHCLRHTYMTYMAGRLPEGKLSRLGIHTNTSMDNLYTHVTDEDRTVIREAVAGLLPSK